MSVNDIRRLAGLNESYQSRVDDVVAYVVRAQPKSKEEIMQWIEVGAANHADVEFRAKDRKGSKAWPHFVKDVLNGLKGKLPRTRSQAAIDAAKGRTASKEKMLQQIADAIQAAAGEAFPDADPIDILIPKLNRMGIDTYDVGDWLDKAARKHLGVKSYNDYLANMWDDVKADGGYGLNIGDRNPWR